MGKKLIDFCKMSDMNILDGRIGKDKSLGNFTCYTTRGSSTIDYVIASTEIFPKFSDLYIDILDSYMSDAHCPVCVLPSCKESYKKDLNVNKKENSKYYIKNHVKTRWNQEHCEQYTLSFDIEHIKTLQDKLNTILYDMTITSENTIEQLYMEIKDVFIQPAKSTSMYKETKERYNRKTKVDRRHGSHVWFNKNCEMLLKNASIKNSLSIKSTPDKTHLLYLKHIHEYKKLVSKIYTKEFHSKIRNLKTLDPKQFWSIIKNETNHNRSQSDTIVFTEFIDHFHELNCIPPKPGADTCPSDTSQTTNNDIINQPFTTVEIKSVIKMSKNNKSPGADYMINEFFKHCHIDCINIIVDFFILYCILV